MQVGCRCIRSVCRFRSFAQIAAPAVAKLSALVQTLDRQLQGKEYATQVEGILTDALWEIQETCKTRDYAVSALLFLAAVAPPGTVDQNTIWPTCLQRLPLVHHHVEAKQVSRLLVRLAGESSPLVQGSSMVVVVTMVVETLELNNAVEADAQNTAKAFLKWLGPQLQGMQASLTPKRQRKLVRILADA